MTDEQFLAYIDAATDRIVRTHEREFDAMVEAVRVGTIVASDRKAFGRWQSIRARREAKAVGAAGGGLSGASLERAILGIAAANPGLVAER